MIDLLTHSLTYRIARSALLFFSQTQNDECEDAIDIVPSLSGTTVTGSTIDATFDGVSTCGDLDDRNTGPGVWYRFCSGKGGEFNLITDYDRYSPVTKISVYTRSCADLVCVDGYQDGVSSTTGLKITTEPDTKYFVLIHS